MEEILNMLKCHIEVVEDIGNRIEKKQPYTDVLKDYLPSLQEVTMLFFGLCQDDVVPLELNQDFVLQVLSDIIYGIENEDEVFLLDVLRYGLLEIYYYIFSECQNGEDYE